MSIWQALRWKKWEVVSGGSSGSAEGFHGRGLQIQMR